MGEGSKELHCGLRYAVTSIHPSATIWRRKEGNKENINMWWEPQPKPHRINGPGESSSSARWQNMTTNAETQQRTQFPSERQVNDTGMRNPLRAVRYAAFRETNEIAIRHASARAKRKLFICAEKPIFEIRAPRAPPPSADLEIKLLSQFRFNFSIGPPLRRRDAAVHSHMRFQPPVLVGRSIFTPTRITLSASKNSANLTPRGERELHIFLKRSRTSLGGFLNRTAVLSVHVSCPESFSRSTAAATLYLLVRI